MARRLLSPWLSCLLAAALALPLLAAATPLKIGLLVRADDPRLERRRLELAYPGHPGGAAEQAVKMALDEVRFELDAARRQATLETVEVRDAAQARATLQRLAQAGVVGVLADLPADWLAQIAAAATVPLLNVGAAEDRLRALCTPLLFHTLPSERMRVDALAQHLLARRWQRVLLLQGPRPEDATRAATVQAALKRYGLKLAATRPFKLSADPRERELGNLQLLTAGRGAEHDVVWVVDSDGEFARTVPYRTALPRPVVGDAGLTAQAWAPNFERFGAPQLARRFARAAQRPMTGHDWAAWMGTKALVQAAIANPAAPLAALSAEDFVLDGFKGTRNSFRAWNRQLRQPLLLSDGLGVIGSAPVEGVLHPKNVLDTLGADAPESPCKPR
jgi:ABC transporter substrate binding protein (PQQ-dependent alcohol dehydrogenase system)